MKEYKINKKKPIFLLSALALVLSFGSVIEFIFNAIISKYHYSFMNLVNIFISSALIFLLYLVWTANIFKFEEKLQKPYGILAVEAILFIKFCYTNIVSLINIFQGVFFGRVRITEYFSSFLYLMVYILACAALIFSAICLLKGNEELFKKVTLAAIGVLAAAVIISLIIGFFGAIISLIKFFGAAGFNVQYLISFIANKIFEIISQLASISFYASVIIYLLFNKIPLIKKAEE